MEPSRNNSETGPSRPPEYLFKRSLEIAAGMQGELARREQNRRSSQINERSDRRAKKQQIRRDSSNPISPVQSTGERPLPSPVTPTTAEAPMSLSMMMQEQEQQQQPLFTVAQPTLNQNSQTMAAVPGGSTRYSERPMMPEWYTSINNNSLRMKEISKRRPQALNALEGLIECVSRCVAEHHQQQKEKLFDELRDLVHKAEITLQIDKYIVKKSRILLPAGLPWIFHQDSNFPSDLKADAYQLYNRWMSQEFEMDPMRGLIHVKKNDRSGDRLDKAYKANHPTSSCFHGNGDFVNGQCWPTQLCTFRDGAHGATQGGISGATGRGAFSIILSAGTGYWDEDHGTTVYYSGTAGSKDNPTENTNHMLTSHKLGHPIRVIRSSNMSKGNPYKPEIGFRYDGLYTVVGYELKDEETAMYTFRLERCPGQDEIRYKEGPSQRPTRFEKKAFRDLRA